MVLEAIPTLQSAIQQETSPTLQPRMGGLWVQKSLSCFFWFLGPAHLNLHLQRGRPWWASQRHKSSSPNSIIYVCGVECRCFRELRNSITHLGLKQSSSLVSGVVPSLKSGTCRDHNWGVCKTNLCCPRPPKQNFPNVPDKIHLVWLLKFQIPGSLSALEQVP